ncbi:glycosyltransferase family 39 protein [Acidobacteriota bacterium]
MSKTLVWVLFVVILFTGLFLRLFLYEYTATPDGDRFKAQAEILVAGKGYSNAQGLPTAYVSPMFPCFLSLLLSLFGDKTPILLAAQAVVGLLTCITLWYAAERAGGRAAGMAALAFSALYLPSCWISKTLLSEVLFTFFFSAMMVLLLRAVETAGWWSPVLAGALLAAAILTKPVVLLFPAVMLLWALILPTPKRLIAVRASLCALIIGAILVAPWSWRNYRAFDAFVPVSTQGGASLWLGVHPPDEGFGFSNWKEADQALAGRTPSDEAEWNREMTRLAVKEILENPGRFAGLFVLKLFYFWHPFGGDRYIGFSIYNIFFGLNIALWCLSLIWLSRRNPLSLLVALTVLYWLLMGALFSPVLRYRYPVELFIIPAWSVFWFSKERKLKAEWIWSIGLGILVTNVVLLLWGHPLYQILRSTFHAFFDPLQTAL